MEALPRKFNLGDTKPIAVPAYKKRIINTPQNPNDIFLANQVITIPINTGTPGAFLDNEETYLRFTFTIENSNPYIDFINFGSAGAASFIEQIAINANGTDVEVIQDYNTLFEFVKDLQGNTYQDFNLFRHTRNNKSLLQQSIRNLSINSCKKPMCDRSGRIMNAAVYASSTLNASGPFSAPAELRNVYFPHYQGRMPTPSNYFGATPQGNGSSPAIGGLVVYPTAPGTDTWPGAQTWAASPSTNGQLMYAAMYPPNQFTGILEISNSFLSMNAYNLAKFSETSTGSFLTSQYSNNNSNANQFLGNLWPAPWPESVSVDVTQNPNQNMQSMANFPLYYGTAGNFVSGDMPIFWDSSGNNINGWPANMTNNLVYEDDQYDYAEIRMQDYFQYYTNVKRIPVGCYSTMTPVQIPVFTGIPSQYNKFISTVGTTAPTSDGSVATNNQKLSVPTYAHPAAVPSNTSKLYNNGRFSVTVCMPMLGGILGVFAAKMFPVFLADQLYVKITLTNPYKAFSVSMDPCNIVRGTYRDFSTNIGIHPGTNITNIVFDSLTMNDTFKVRNPKTMWNPPTVGGYQATQVGANAGGLNPAATIMTQNEGDNDCPFVAPSPFTYYAAGGIHPQYFLPYVNQAANPYSYNTNLTNTSTTGAYTNANHGVVYTPVANYTMYQNGYLTDKYLPGGTCDPIDTTFQFDAFGAGARISNENSLYTAYIPFGVTGSEDPEASMGFQGAITIPMNSAPYIPLSYIPPPNAADCNAGTSPNQVSCRFIALTRNNNLPIDQSSTPAPYTVYTSYNAQQCLSTTGFFLQTTTNPNTYGVPIYYSGGSTTQPTFDFVTLVSANANIASVVSIRNNINQYLGPNGINTVTYSYQFQDAWQGGGNATGCTYTAPTLQVNVGNPSAACYGTCLDESTDQYLRCFQNGSFPGGFRNQWPNQANIPVFLITNVALITSEILLPDSVTAEVISSATRGDISILTKTYKTYQTNLSNNTPNQNIQIPANIASANTLYTIFRPSPYYSGAANQLAYNSLKRICPIGAVVFPTPTTSVYTGSDLAPTIYPISNDSTGAFSFQLKIGGDLLPQNPISSIPEILAEAEKCQHSLWGAMNSNLMVATTSSQVAYANVQTGTNTNYSATPIILPGSTNTATYSLIAHKGFTTTFLDFNYMADQTAFNNPYHIAMDIDYMPLITGAYQLPMHKPPEGTFYVAFDLDPISGTQETAMGGRYLGNWNTSLQCQGLQFMSTLNNTSNLNTNNAVTGVLATTFIYCDMRVSFQAGGNIQTFT
jgi:hypothetical protein